MAADANGQWRDPSGHPYPRGLRLEAPAHGTSGPAAHGVRRFRHAAENAPRDQAARRVAPCPCGQPAFSPRHSELIMDSTRSEQPLDTARPVLGTCPPTDDQEDQLVGAGPASVRTRGATVRPFPASRRLVTAAVRAGRRIVPMHGLLEVDVAEARRLLAAHDPPLSLTGFVVASGRPRSGRTSRGARL